MQWTLELHSWLRLAPFIIPASPTTGIIGIGLIGDALMKMTGASRGWDVDEPRYSI
jgi:hypothetical protein